MERIPDDPIIERLQKYGTLEDVQPAICPICGEDCHTVYLDKDGEIFACDVCLITGDAFEYENEGEIEPCHAFCCPCCENQLSLDETIEIYFDRFGQEIQACGECVCIVEALEDERCFPTEY